MDPLKQILTGLDCSRQAHNALRQAARIARRHGARLGIVHVIDPEARKQAEEATRDKPVEPGMRPMRRMNEAEIRRCIGERIVEVGAEDLEPDIIVLHGDRYEQLEEVVREYKAQILVLGSRGSTSIHEGASSLAVRGIRDSRAQVLIVRHAHDTPYSQIGAFIDFSANTREVLGRAVEIAGVDQAELHVYHVFLPPWKVAHYMSPTPSATPEKQERYRKGLRRRMKRALKPFGKQLGDLPVHYHLVESSEKILGIDHFIEESGVDLVVINTRGRRGLKKFLMRTVAEHIVRTSPSSVLVIKPRPFGWKLSKGFL